MAAKKIKSKTRASGFGKPTLTVVAQTPAQIRNEKQDLFEEHRTVLLDAARKIAVRIARRTGRVTSVHVIDALQKSEHGPRFRSVDARFIGAVFRNPMMWARVGWEPLGSHARLVSVWRLKKSVLKAKR